MAGEDVAGAGVHSWRRFIWVCSGGMIAAAVLYAVGVLCRDSDAFSPLVDGFLSLLTVWLPAVVCWLVVGRARSRRPDIALVAAAVSCQAAGDTYYAVQSAGGGNVPLPSPADIGYVGFYILMLAALLVVVRGRLRDMTWPVVLDSVVGGLGAAAALTVVMGPVFGSAGGGSQSVAAASITRSQPTCASGRSRFCRMVRSDPIRVSK